MKLPERSRKVLFGGAFCSRLMLEVGEVEEGQRDNGGESKKCDRAKTRTWAGATPLLSPSVWKVTVGSLPPTGAIDRAAYLRPVAAER
jgi:hypothetical protein